MSLMKNVVPEKIRNGDLIRCFNSSLIRSRTGGHELCDLLLSFIRGLFFVIFSGPNCFGNWKLEKSY